MQAPHRNKVNKYKQYMSEQTIAQSHAILLNEQRRARDNYRQAHRKLSSATAKTNRSSGATGKKRPIESSEVVLKPDSEGNRSPQEGDYSEDARR